MKSLSRLAVDMRRFVAHISHPMHHGAGPLGPPPLQRQAVMDLAGARARLEEVVSRFERLAANGTHADLPGNGQEE